MNARIEELAQRRLALQARSLKQREELAGSAETLRRQITGVDAGMRLFKRAASAPLLVGAAFAALAVFGPMRVLRWAGQGLLLISAYRRIARLTDDAS